MSHVEGVGGAFLFSENPARLAQWYTDNLGVVFESYGENTQYKVFYAVDPDDPKRKLDTTFSIMKAKVAMPPREVPDPEPSEQNDMYGDQRFMLNLAIRDLDVLLAELKPKGIEAIRRDDEGYGIFAWVRDADGNRIELYQRVSDPDA